MRRKCIFCERDDQKITKEHLFPNWMNSVFEKDAVCINEGINADGSVAFSYPSKMFQSTLNDVCIACNNGWMSAIELEAKPILIKMLKGKSLVLDKKKQLKLATWAMKTILVINHGNPPPPAKPFIPPEHYAKFYKLKAPEAENITLLGYRPFSRFNTGDLIAANRLSIAENFMVPKDMIEDVKLKIEKEGKNIYGATLCIGRVVLQLIGNNVYDGTTHRIEIFLPEEPLRILNPYNNKIRWPLKHSIDEVGGLEVIHDALKGS